MPRKRLIEKGYSNRQLKQMVHENSAIVEVSRTVIVLTPLGEKVAAISAARD
jgi:hypothetical protein